MIWLVVVVMCTLLPSIFSFSSGDVQMCDVYGPWGCPNNHFFTDSLGRENRLDCNNTAGNIMDWVYEPERSDKYSVRTGDRERSIDVTNYEPGKIMRIYVRVLEYGWAYRGLLLYAVGSMGNTVGSWEFPLGEQNPYFWTNVNSMCPNRVLHATAAKKPTLSILHYRLPPKGTGTITFRALIKKGAANHGFFYWPMQQDLTITENTRAPAQTWYKANKGESCTARCKRERNLPCDINTMAMSNNMVSFEDAVARQFLCNVPSLSSCNSYVPSMSSNATCWYHDESCPKTISGSGSLSCDATSNTPDGERLCVCGDGSKDPNNPTNKGNPNNPDYVLPVNTGSKFGPTNNLAVQLLVGLVALFGGQRSNYFFVASLILFVFMGSCDAHNWMHTPGRAYTIASTIKPCLGRKLTDTHAQVAPGQEFSIQWATGHSRDSWFVVLHGDDAAEMGRPDLVNVLKDYVANVPATSSAKNFMGANEHLTTKYQRYHGASPDSRSGMDSDYAVGSDRMYTTQLPTSSSVYKLIENPNARNRRNTEDGVVINQEIYQYNSEYLQTDARVSYPSTDYPWIEAVYKYNHLKHLASDFDAIIMTVPGRKGPGHYIVHWRWNGYYDCIDIDVRAEPVPNVYGTPGLGYIWNRVDHCQYLKPRAIATQCAQSPHSADWCKSRLTRTDRRYGINVVPLYNPTSVYPKFLANSSIPWSNRTCVSYWTQLDGQISESPFSMANWNTVSTKKANQECTSISKQYVATLKEAVLFCATSTGCGGVGWEKSTSGITIEKGRHTFSICDTDQTEANNLWDTYVKKTPPVYTATAASVVVSFQPRMCNPPKDTRTGTRSGCRDVEFTPPTGVLVDEGLLYSQQGNYKYGWNCLTPRVKNRFQIYTNEAPTIENTYVHSLHCSCNHYFCSNGDHSPPHKFTDQNRTKWEIEVPNGVYRVTTTHSRGPKYSGDIRAGGCMVENVRVTEDGEVPSPQTYVTEVEVTDGTITLEGKSRAGDDFSCNYLSKLEFQKIATQYAASFMPKATTPWWQLALSKYEPIGLVELRIPTSNCSRWWPYRSNRCLENTIPRGWFETDLKTTGMRVGVSNTSCSGNNCDNSARVLCDRPYAFTSLGYLRSNCQGKWGQYVYIQFPGTDRIISFQEIKIHRAEPEGTKDDFVCWGVQPRVQTATQPEYEVIHDPEDPIFYSTCYVREKNITWVDISYPPSPAPWHFNGQCISCESHARNKKLREAPYLPSMKWEMTGVCKDCDAHPGVIPPINTSEWVLAFTDRTCSSTKNKCAADSCIKSLELGGRGVRKGEGIDEFFLEEECKLAVSTDSECSNTAIWREYSSGKRHRCYCYRSKTCCGECTPSSRNTEYNIFEMVAQPALTGTCVEAGGVESADGTMCCPSYCQNDDDNYCAHEKAGKCDDVHGFCCKSYYQSSTWYPMLAKNCGDYGIPCML